MSFLKHNFNWIEPGVFRLEDNFPAINLWFFNKLSLVFNSVVSNAVNFRIPELSYNVSYASFVVARNGNLKEPVMQMVQTMNCTKPFKSLHSISCSV